jgi:mRNA guanylyltransferase
MPGPILDLNEVGPAVDGQGLHSLRQEVQRLLNRRNPNFPGAQPVSLLKKHRSDLTQTEYRRAGQC